MSHETLCIEPWGANSLRVRATKGQCIRDDLPQALLAAPSTGAQIVIGDNATIRNGAILAEVSAGGFVRFHNAETHRVLLQEVHVEPPVICANRLFKALDSDLFHIEARFDPWPGERFYGMGQHQHGLLDQKGSVIELMQRNTEVAIPFLLSSRGYGFLWNNPAIGRAELGTNGTRWVADASPQMDYWITAGQTTAEIVERYADVTGHAPMLP